MQSRGEAINRTKNAVLWLETEFRPVVAMVREAGLVGDRTGAPYMRIAGERYGCCARTSGATRCFSRSSRARDPAPPGELRPQGGASNEFR